MEKEPITLNGLKKLEEELIFLKETRGTFIVNNVYYNGGLF